jgi:hypothetical protein
MCHLRARPKWCSDDLISRFSVHWFATFWGFISSLIFQSCQDRCMCPFSEGMWQSTVPTLRECFFFSGFQEFRVFWLLVTSVMSGQVPMSLSEDTWQSAVYALKECFVQILGVL